nr:MAG TPA: hypothetical protein [Bacteriophage sp.]
MSQMPAFRPFRCKADVKQCHISFCVCMKARIRLTR